MPQDIAVVIGISDGESQGQNSQLQAEAPQDQVRAGER